MTEDQSLSGPWGKPFSSADDACIKLKGRLTLTLWKERKHSLRTKWCCIKEKLLRQALLLSRSSLLKALCQNLSPQFKANASLKTSLHRWSWRSNAVIKETSLYWAGHLHFPHLKECFTQKENSFIIYWLQTCSLLFFSVENLHTAQFHVTLTQTLFKETSFVLHRRK